MLTGKEPPEVAVLDAQMSEVADGRVPHLIRAFPTGQNLPLLAFTFPGGAALAGAARWWLAAVAKPVMETQFADVLSETFSGGAPARETPASAGGAINPALAKEMPLRVLLVDDNGINQKVGVRVLRQMGYEPAVADSGAEALERAGGGAFDVIFMDVQMPEMDGIEATRRIRRTAGIARPVIIAMTANALPGDREKAIAAGMDDYLTKPIRPEEVQEMLVRWGRGAGSSRPANAAAPVPVSTAGAQPAIVDMARLENLTGGDRAQILELLRLYQEQVPTTLERLKSAIADCDARKLERAAHNCVGSSASCGIVGVVPLMRAIEQFAREGRFAEASGVVAKAEEEFARVRNFVAGIGIGATQV